MAKLPDVVFVLGAPGAGKGTQSKRIVEDFGYTHLSVGDLLRAERSRDGSEVGRLIDTCIREGQIVPIKITISLIKQAMTNIMELDSSKSSFLIDGFPRNEDNVKGWNKHMEDKANVKFVLFFDCDLEICKKRCLDRSQSSGRVDDNEESLNKRIQTYLESSKPIIDQYEKEGKVRRVDASGSVDEIFERLKTFF